MLFGVAVECRDGSLAEQEFQGLLTNRKGFPMAEDSKQKEPGKGITAITVRGFKSLAQETRIDVRPLTILAGANSSGKSSIVQPLLLLKQTLEATFDPGPVWLDGPNIRFTSADQLFCKVTPKPAARFTATIDVDHGEKLSLSFERDSERKIELAESAYSGRFGHVPLNPTMESSEIESVLPSPLVSSIKSWIFDPKESNSGKQLHFGIVRKRCFLNVIGTVVSSKGETYTEYSMLPGLNRFGFEMRNVIHVPGLRGNPERTYQTAGFGQMFPGTFQPYVASIVNHWKSEKDDALRQLGADLMTLGLTWKVDARAVDHTQVELQVGRLPRPKQGGAQDLVNIADVGLGVSQVLPVVVALLTAEPGQLVYIEQPEIHLHPRAQVALAKLLAAAAKRGVRVIAETHSQLLLLGIQTLVAEGDLSPDLVKLHWFQRGEDGTTDVTSADLDEQGRFGNWPEDFADVELNAESKFLDAAAAALETNR